MLLLLGDYVSLKVKRRGGKNGGMYFGGLLLISATVGSLLMTLWNIEWRHPRRLPKHGSIETFLSFYFPLQGVYIIFSL